MKENTEVIEMKFSINKEDIKSMIQDNLPKLCEFPNITELFINECIPDVEAMLKADLVDHIDYTIRNYLPDVYNNELIKDKFVKVEGNQNV